MAVKRPRWLRSARRRPAAAAAILLLSAGAVAVSTVTPMLLGAVSAATLREDVAAAVLPANGITVTTSSSSDDVGLSETAADDVLEAATRRSDRWGAPRTVLESAYTPTIRASADGYRTAPRFSVALGGCAGLRFTGRCPAAATEALLPRSVARSSGWRIGTVLLVPGDGLTTIRIAVVGLYDEDAGRGRWLADPTILSVATVPRAVPDVVIGDSVLNLLPSTYTYTASTRIGRPVRQADVPALRRSVAAAVQESLGAEAAEVSAAVRTGLPDLLDSIGRQQAAAVQLAAPIALEALVLAWFALGAVAQRTARARAAEWGISRMRGFRWRAWFAGVFVEPLVAVLAGAALGCPLAVLASRAVSTAVLGTAADVAPIAPAVGAALALALAGSLVALAAATLRAARLPLHELLGDSAEPRRLTRPALIGQVALVSTAVAVAWATFTSTGADGPQPGLLLPALLAMVAGLAAVRIAVLLVRRASARAPRSLTGLVVGRGLARAPSALVAAQLVLVSAALGAYTLQVGAASASLQTDRAALRVGAARVLRVQVPAGVSLLDSVRRADPTGRVALAAAELGDDTAEDTARVVAVDTGRVDAVSTWRRAWQGGVDLSRLRATGQDLVLRGARATITIGGLGYGGAFGLPKDPGVLLQAILVSGHAWRTVDIGILKDGAVSAAIPCSAGCRLVALTMHDATTGENSPWGARFVISSLETDRQPAAELRPWLVGARWRARLDGPDPRIETVARTGSASQGLAVLVQDRSGELAPQIEPAVGPALIPAVVAADTDLTPFPGVPGAVRGIALSAADVLLHPVARAAALPRSLRLGVLVDLGEMERVSDPARPVAQPEVWLTGGTHPTVLAALARVGIRVTGTETAAAEVRAGLRTATNRTLVLSGATALIAVLFGLLALAAARIVDMPGRRQEWRAVRLAGVPARRLRRLAVVQLAVPSVIGAVLGALAGSLAATLTVGRLPLLVEQTPGPPLDVAPPVVVLIVLTAAVVLLVVLVAAALVRAEVRTDAP